jgi:F0F1-type ATP synthase assembly protein I
VDEEKTCRETREAFILIIGIIIGLVLAMLIKRKSGVVFNRDQQGNIVSIHYI